MLTHPTAIALYRKLVQSSPEALQANIPLLAKCARHVKHTAGRQEARQFIGLIRAALAV